MPTWFLKLKQHSEIRGRKSIFKLEATRLFVGLCWRVGWLVEVNLMLVKLPAKNKNTRFNARSRWNECINFINTTNRWSDDILKNIDAISDFRYLIYITSQQEGSEFKSAGWELFMSSLHVLHASALPFSRNAAFLPPSRDVHCSDNWYF